MGLDGEMIDDLFGTRPSRPVPVNSVSLPLAVLSTCPEDNVRLDSYECPIITSRILSAMRRAQESQPLDPETIAKRTKRHLDELEVRSFPCRLRLASDPLSHCKPSYE